MLIPTWKFRVRLSSNLTGMFPLLPNLPSKLNHIIIIFFSLNLLINKIKNDKSRNRSGVNLHRFVVNYKWNIWLSLAIIVKLPRDRVKLHLLGG